ncbi:MAG: hypothetical protein IJV16_07175 [Lachnospiraceae bacterium]|nr:hypothetical protein [Lachnospiraceae bacterium]
MSVSEAEDGGCLIELDQTLFFPEEGGQTSDRGKLSGFDVIHVSINDDIIIHEVDCGIADLREGDEVRGIIDWQHRFSNMQNHTGEHILSGLLHSRWQSENVGFHLSDNIVTLDTSKELGREDLKELEKEANKVVYLNLTVTCRYYSEEELAGEEYRSKKALESDVRLVTIPDVDVCACCAPHVARTGEIGIIKIIKAIRYKGGMRLTFLAGERAYDYLCGVHDTIEEISHTLSESPDSLNEAVTRILRENNELEIKIKNAAKARLEADIGELPPDITDAVIFTDPVDNIVQRNAVNELAGKYTGICAVFASDGKDGYNYILSYPSGDARDISKILREKLDARGGGSKEMVQGNVKAMEADIREALTKAHKDL